MAAAGAGVMKLANDGAVATDRVDKLSQKLGISREGMQEWDYVLSQSGVSIDNMQTSMKSLTNHIMDANAGAGQSSDLFAQLGITITDSMSQEEVFNATVTALQGMEDGVTKASLAQELFGKSGRDLLPLLNDTTTNVDALKKQAHDLGLIMSDETVDSGVLLGDTMDALKKTLSAGLVPAMAAVMPIVTSLAQTFIDYAPQIIGMMKPVFDLLMPTFAEMTEKLLPILIKLFENIFTNILPPFMDLVSIIVTDLLPPFMELFGEVIEAILPILSELLGFIIDYILPPFIELFRVIVKDIAPVFISLFKEIAKVVLPLLSAAFEILKPVIESLMEVFKGIISFVKNVFKGDWEAAWKDVAGIFTSIWDGIKGVFKGIINWIIEGINKMIRAINGISVKIPDWVPEVGGDTIGFSISEIPLLAKGGRILSGGSAIVGEAGAELIDLPTGATVTPLNGSGGIVFERGAFEGMTVLDDYGVDRLMDRIVGRLGGLGVVVG